jgi:hypothetical protein
MRSHSGPTDTLHEVRLPAEGRAYFSATGARLRDEVWLRVETHWVSTGTKLTIRIFIEEQEGQRQSVKELPGKIDDNEGEQKWRVEIPKQKLDELHGPIHLRFEAELAGHDRKILSQTLLVHRTRFSS